jgi:hypothetical protein
MCEVLWISLQGQAVRVRQEQRIVLRFARRRLSNVT